MLWHLEWLKIYIPTLINAYIPFPDKLYPLKEESFSVKRLTLQNSDPLQHIYVLCSAQT